MDLLMMNSAVMILYYCITAFFLFALIRNFFSTGSIQEAVLYAVVMFPFILRLLRLK